MSLSVSATARLQRQRRLQSCSPVTRAVTPASIKRRSKQSGANDNEATGSLGNTSMCCTSFDEEVTAATTPSSEISTPTGGGSANKHGRSFSFSSFSEPFLSEPFPSEPEEEGKGFQSPTSATSASEGSYSIVKVMNTSAAAVTPPGSPGLRPPSLRNPSPSPTVGALLDPRSRTPLSHTRPSLSRTNSSRSVPSQGSPKRFLSLTNGDANDEMPMDELKHSSGRGTRSTSNRPPTSMRRPSLELLTNGAHHTASTDIVPSSSSTALVPSTSSSSNNLHRMAQALQTKTRPAYMTADEKHLWDVIHSLLPSSSSSSAMIAITPSSSSAGDTTNVDWEHQYQQREAEWKMQQDEHDRALRAIQRVLADVTTERENAVEQLQQELERSQQQRDDTILKLTQKLKQLTQDSNSKAASAGEIDSPDNKKREEEVANLKEQIKEIQETNDYLQHDLQVKEEKVANTERSLLIAQLSLQEEPDKATRNTLLLELQEENEEKTQVIDHLKKQLLSCKDSEVLRKELEEKTASLENAKMIIASLENANGSLAQELRAKLKEKEEELASLSATSADRKKTLDCLATELRELQRHGQKPNVTKEHLEAQRNFCQFLEKNVRALRQAAVQHEARNDQQTVDRISHIVSETFTSLKHSLESWDSYLSSVEASDAPTGDKHNMESALSKKNDETKVLRKELDRVRSESNQEITQLRQEVKTLREQLSTNMEILAKKGRELSVLRDSLDLDDNDVGYISDDGTEGFDTEGEHGTSFPCTALTLYGSANPNAAETSDAAAAEIQMLKNELLRAQKEREVKASELQAEKESLANAKMIISSLEKANKSMLEDLRSRLQDSNTAIASLLEKSMEHEKSTTALKKEVEDVKKEREDDENKSKQELAKLRDENLVFSMRLAAKEREIDELQNLLSEYEGTEVPMKQEMMMSSVEEKKEDPAVADE